VAEKIAALVGKLEIDRICHLRIPFSYLGIGAKVLFLC
jgi:hypothetical protein